MLSFLKRGCKSEHDFGITGQAKVQSLRSMETWSINKIQYTLNLKWNVYHEVLKLYQFGFVIGLVISMLPLINFAHLIDSIN